MMTITNGASQPNYERDAIRNAFYSRTPAEQLKLISIFRAQFVADNDLVPVATTADNESTFWACVDCVLARESNEGDITSNAWCLLADASVSFDHTGDADTEEETRIEFSTADCEACGSVLAGTRYRYTLYAN
jgi:hypothetical protein